MWVPGGRTRSAKADASRPKHSLLPNTSGVSTPMTRTFPIPLSQTVSPSVLRVTTAGCVEFEAVASGWVLVPQPAAASAAAANSSDKGRRINRSAATIPFSPPIRWSIWDRSVVGAEPVPAIQLEGLGGQFRLALCRQPRHDGVDDGVAAGLLAREGVVASEARGDLQRLAAVVAQARECLQQELLVGDGLTDIQRCMPGG